MFSRPPKSVTRSAPLRPFRNPVYDLRSDGQPAAIKLLKHALEQTQKPDSIELLQQFHPYPGRMHPAWAQVLLTAIKSEILDTPSPVLLDPFCGSGTVLLEAARLGFEAYGNDLNPVAYHLSEVKGSGLLGLGAVVLKNTQQLLEQVQLVKKTQRERRFEALKSYYAPHVLVRLITLLKVLENFEFARDVSPAQAEKVRAVWKIVFSTLVTKFSDRRSEVHQDEQTTKQFNPHSIYRFFGQKVEELVKAHQLFWGKNTRFKIALGQEDLMGLKPPKLAQCIFTSPPYPGVFDYADHHHLRCLWLNWEDKFFKQKEWVPRRQNKTEAVHFEATLLRKMNAWVQPGQAQLVLLVGDYLHQQKPVSVEQLLVKEAKVLGWQLNGLLSMKRGRFAGSTHTKYEHVVWLKREK